MKNHLITIKKHIHKRLKRKFSILDRETIAASFLKGTGIEIGAMDMPLHVPSVIDVKYLDRINKEEQLKIFSNLNTKTLKEADIIDDCETMKSVGENSFDFIIANHVIEHLENPILALLNWIKVLKQDGIIFLAIPDKRYTFDCKRNTTTYEHLLNDYENGILTSREDHYFDFVKNTTWGENKDHDGILKQIEYLKSINFSIHYHVWDHTQFLVFITKLINDFKIPCSLEFACRLNNTNENIYILRK
ncbi:MAG: methyltransferase domain-containing protein [Marinilabiliaceae bacterium]|nr:methyltransferase domain-containing protein [Marinilabiliaceae bacterium]